MSRLWASWSRPVQVQVRPIWVAAWVAFFVILENAPDVVAAVTLAVWLAVLVGYASYAIGRGKRTP